MHRLTTGIALVVVGLPNALAAPVSTSLVFAKPDINPWTGGPAFVRSRSTRLEIPRIGADFPAARIGALGPLDSFLPFDLLSASAGLSGGARGALEVGYHVNGGRLNLLYPARGSIDVDAPGGAISVFASALTTTGFTPGLERLVLVPSAMPTIAGSGWNRMEFIAPTLELDVVNFIDRPRFQTVFPTASAYAKLDYTVDVAAYVKATAISVLGFNIGVRRDFGTSFNNSMRLVDINPQGIEYLGEGRLPVFDNEYSIGAASIRTAYPDPKVHAWQSGPNPSFGGGDVKPVVEIIGNLEQLIPAVGQFLSASWGPFKATLLEVDGGPTFSIYQDMQLDVRPTVTLLFDRAVSWVKDGVRRLVTRIDALAGETIDWSPILGGDGTISVQPVYNLGASFRNETGLAIGYRVNIDALRMTDPLSLGPIDLYDRFDPTLARIPFFNEYFPISTSAMPGAVQTFDVTVAALFATGLTDRSVAIDSLTSIGRGFWALRVRDVLTGAVASPTFSGIEFEEGGERFVRALAGGPSFDISIPGLGVGQMFLGDLFCLTCRSFADQFLTSGPQLTDAGGGLVQVTALFDHVIPEICTGGGTACDPDLNRRAENVRTDENYYIGPVTVAASEPPAGALVALGLGLAVALRRQRAVATPFGRRW